MPQDTGLRTSTSSSTALSARKHDLGVSIYIAKDNNSGREGLAVCGKYGKGPHQLLTNVQVRAVMGIKKTVKG